jgi:hypothetical protein
MPERLSDVRNVEKIVDLKTGIKHILKTFIEVKRAQDDTL